MSVRDLVTGECGAPNPLMQLAHKVHAGNIQQREIGIPRQLEDNVLAEDESQQVVYMPQTFNMQNLLDGMNGIQINSTNVSNDVFSRSSADVWKDEYSITKGYSMKSNAVNSNSKDILDFSHLDRSSVNFSNQMIMPPSFIPMLPPQQPLQNLGNEKWAHQYLDNVNGETGAVEKTAHEILESFEKEQDKTVAEKLDMKNVVADTWAKEYEDTGNEDVLELKEQVTKELEQDVEYWQKLQQEWTEMFGEMQRDDGEDLRNGYEHQYGKDYEFEKQNPFEGLNGAFEKGLQKLNEGDLISAILLFEEAVQVNPDHVEAWQYLGTSQAENEQEVLAIQALNKCLQLQPDNLIARMSVAVSYTNEYLQTEAYKALKLWIKHNPAYSHLIDNSVNDLKAKVGSSLMTNSMFEELQHLYLTAARTTPQGNIDADVQLGLGVLFNLSGDYQKAVDCFNVALQARPDSATLWNKLGATLANGSRSAEAIEAYRNALELRPGFIRCRYNLGISCVNMKSYPEAIEHFLGALSMQRQGEDPSRPASTMSENIWSTLRMTISLLGRLDLMNHVDKRNLDFLSEEFKMNVRFYNYAGECGSYDSHDSFDDAVSCLEQYCTVTLQWYCHTYLNTS